LIEKIPNETTSIRIRITSSDNIYINGRIAILKSTCLMRNEKEVIARVPLLMVLLKKSYGIIPQRRKETKGYPEWVAEAYNSEKTTHKIAIMEMGSSTAQDKPKRCCE
jgi:hypothetical protein